MISKISGVVANFSKPNKNGRIYPIELWENLIKSKKFIEQIKTLTLFGGLGTPKFNLEIPLSSVATVLYDLEIDKVNSDIIAHSYILDTPSGRLVKHLLNNESNLEFVSRGLGDITTKDNIHYINPETYRLHGIDIILKEI